MPGAYENKGAMAATIVVAASDSLNKGAANYVCDGVADDVEINAALAALPAGRVQKETVKCIGTFTLAATITPPSYSTLDLTEARLVRVAAGGGHMINIDSMANVKVVGGVVDGNKAAQIAPYTAHCIRIDNASDVVIDRVEVKNSTLHGIVCTDALCTRVSILNCLTHDNGAPGEIGSGVYMWANDSQVLGLTTYDNTGDGVQASNSNNLIIEAYSYSNDRYGTYENTCNNLVLRGVYNSNVSYGVYVQACLYAQVEVISLLNGTYGIRWTDTSYSFLRAISCNNSQTGTGYGLILINASTHNVITGVYSDDQGAHTQDYGIREQATGDYNTIIGVIATGNTVAQIATVGVNTIVRNNIGYITENSSLAAIPRDGATTTKAWPHGLAATPTSIIVTALETGGAGNFVTTIGATNFTINIPLAIALSAIAVSGAVAVDGGVETDETVPANNATVNDMTLLPAVPVVDDAYDFVGSQMYGGVRVNIGTQGIGVWTIVWEYYNTAGAWSALAGVVDGTTGFTAVVGNRDVSFTIPTNWANATIYGKTGYHVRARVSAYTSIVTQPKGTQSWLLDALHFMWRAAVGSGN